jgi:hypothetical protein
VSAPAGAVRLLPPFLISVALGLVVAVVWLQDLNGTLDPGDASIAVLLIAFPAMGAFIAYRRPGNPIGWLLAAGGFFQLLTEFTGQYAAYAVLTSPGALPLGSTVGWVEFWVWPLPLGSLIFLFLLLPSGRLVSNRWRWTAWLTGGALALLTVPTMVTLWPLRGPALVSDESEQEVVPELTVTFIDIGFGVLIVSAVLAGVSLIVRWRRSRGVERQQLKWLVYCLGLVGGGSILDFVVLPALGVESDAIATSISTGGLLMVPVAFAVAVFRYRLYEIDRIISRTLLYGLLTAFLALVYYGLVVALQQVLGERVRGSGLAVAASTLAAAALFRPARSRIQTVLDRRFNRRRYDAQQTVEAFSARLRDQLDLDSLTTDMLGVVRDTVQPAHASLWLRTSLRSGAPSR